ncbi:SRPBCC family protein [Actinospica robiniae]|uniref:SRPBCC family protein n=1 Tax=Actinospica robiniae TaxID=304901 RepID=UPI0004192F95|nr:SRPBCC family protein [Actinospica robiniae]
MAKEDEDSKKGGGLEELGKELVNYLSHVAQGLVDKSEGKIGDVVGRLTDSAISSEDASPAMKAGARALKGENPASSFFKERAKGFGGKVKNAIPGMGGGDGDGGGGGGGGGGNIKVINIIESIDVPVPLRKVYDQWTQLEEFGSMVKGVQSVDAKDEVTTSWKAKIAFSNRSWTATVQEQVPDERIHWTSEGAKGSTEGVVTFHELGPNLTRIVVVVEYTPAGFFEKTANIWRAQGRRLRLDLKHFARHVSLHLDEDVEGWRGEIQDGEVVSSGEEEEPEEGEEEYEGEDGEGEGEEEGYDEDEDEDEDYDDEDYDEDEDEEEDDRR